MEENYKNRNFSNLIIALVILIGLLIFGGIYLRNHGGLYKIDERKVTEKINNQLSDSTIANEEKAKFDTVKSKQLDPFFRKKTDEYSKLKKVWYEPNTAPSFINQNGIYCHFEVINGVACNLQFSIQYYAEEWLFFESVQFVIDGKASYYTPINKETDSGDGGHIWEWFDDKLTDADKDLIYALANAKSAKMKFNGKQYYKEKNITQEQVKSIRQSLELYNAMGGVY